MTGYVLTSSDLYGDYSYRDEIQNSTVIRTSIDQGSQKSPDLFFKPEHKGRVFSSTGGKN